MTESYELQVLFTEEERNTYADWGIKKEKVLMPFAIATVLIYVVTAAFVVMKVWGVRGRLKTGNCWAGRALSCAPRVTGKNRRTAIWRPCVRRKRAFSCWA